MAYVSHEFLYRLVSGLEPKQKKDFAATLHNQSRVKAQSNYQLLFEELVKLNEYDEVKLKYRLKKAMTDEVMAVVKNKLTEKLLDFLRNTEEETPVKKLHKWLDYMELLFKKQLYADVVLYCEKLKKEAWESDLHTLIIEANRWKGFCLVYIEREHYHAARQQLTAENQRSLDMISLTVKASEYYHQVLARMHQHFNLRNSGFRQYMADMMNHPLFAMDAADEQYSFLPACYVAMTKHFIYKFQGDYEASYQQERIVWNRVSKDFNFSYKNKRAETLASMTNYLEALSKTNHTEIFVKHMALIEKLLTKEEKGNAQLKATLIIYQLNHLAKVKGESLTRHDVEPYVKYLKSGAMDAFTDYKRLLESYLANAYFLLGEYELASDLMLGIQKEYSRNEVRPDMYEYSRINRIVYEGTMVMSRGLKTADIHALLNLVNPYHDHIRHKPTDDDYRLEACLTDFFRSLKPNITRKEVLKKVIALEGKLDALFSEEQGFLKLIRADFEYPLMIKRWKRYLV